MIRTLYILYHIILFVCFITSLVTYKYNKSFKIFPWLMGFTVLIEWSAYVLVYIYVVNPFWLYHFYLPVMGILIAYFLYHLVRENSVKKIVMVLSIVYASASMSLTFFFYQLTDFPGSRPICSGFF